MKKSQMHTCLVVMFASTLLAGSLVFAGEEFKRNALGYLTLVDDHGVILDGHDPVSFFTKKKPVKGSASHKARYMGATYHFATAANREAFLADPARYAPQFGAFCSMAVSMGMLEPGDVETFSIVDGRLLLQRNKKAMKMWRQDAQGNLKRADDKWPTLVSKTAESR